MVLEPVDRRDLSTTKRTQRYIHQKNRLDLASYPPVSLLALHMDLKVFLVRQKAIIFCGNGKFDYGQWDFKH